MSYGIQRNSYETVSALFSLLSVVIVTLPCLICSDGSAASLYSAKIRTRNMGVGPTTEMVWFHGKRVVPKSKHL